MNQITNFWNHFKQNNFVYLLMTEIPKEELAKHFTELNNLLRLFNKDLDLILKNGNPYLFKEVELLVHHAPVLERLQITAFLQPETNLSKYKTHTDKPLEYYGISLKISEMYFEPLKIQNKPLEMGIRVYIKNYIIHYNKENFRNAIYIHLEYLLGEKSFANDISLIDVAQQPSDIEEMELLNLYDLADYIKNLKKNRNNLIAFGRNSNDKRK